MSLQRYVCQLQRQIDSRQMDNCLGLIWIFQPSGNPTSLFSFVNNCGGGLTEALTDKYVF